MFNSKNKSASQFRNNSSSAENKTEGSAPYIKENILSGASKNTSATHDPIKEVNAGSENIFNQISSAEFWANAEPMTFNEIQEGDIVPGTENFTSVSTVYDVHDPQTMYEIETSAGVVRVSGNHLWLVETEFDRSLHNNRIKKSKKILSVIPKVALKELENIAENYDQPVETTLADVAAMLGCLGNPQAEEVLTRIAESIGHIAEESTFVEDLYTNNQHKAFEVRLYDARIFAQQILSIVGGRAWRKKYPVIVGKVVTTEKMFELSSKTELYIPNAIQAAKA